MPLYIKDDSTAELVDKLAKLRGVSKQDAVKHAVQSELTRMRAEIPLIERIKQLWEANPLPPATGKIADKGFFDELSGGL